MMASGISLVYKLVQSMDPTFLQTPMALPKLLWLAILGRIAFGTVTNPSTLDACPGYDVVRASSTGSSLSADLVLAGNACNIFGKDVSKLQLDVTYETSKRFLHALLASLSLTCYPPLTRVAHTCQDYGPLISTIRSPRICSSPPQSRSRCDFSYFRHSVQLHHFPIHIFHISYLYTRSPVLDRISSHYI